AARLELAADLDADQRGVRRKAHGEHGRGERGDADQAAEEAASPPADGASFRRLARGLLLARATVCVSACRHFESVSASASLRATRIPILAAVCLLRAPSLIAADRAAVLEACPEPDRAPRRATGAR